MRVYYIIYNINKTKFLQPQDLIYLMFAVILKISFNIKINRARLDHSLEKLWRLRVDYWL